MTYHFCPLLLQISLVQFFIENFQKIFEDNTSTLSGESSVISNNREEISDTFNYFLDLSAAQDEEKSCVSERTRSKGDAAVPQHLSAAPHEGGFPGERRFFYTLRRKSRVREYPHIQTVANPIRATSGHTMLLQDLTNSSKLYVEAHTCT